MDSTIIAAIIGGVFLLLATVVAVLLQGDSAEKEKTSGSTTDSATAGVEEENKPPLHSILNIPHIRNKNFSGREDLLKTLRDSLNSGKAAALTAIHGLGGVGKTQIATEYVYRHKDDYKIIWWIRSEDTATLAADYASLAGKLDLPEKEEQDQKVTVAAVRDRLDQITDWLLVFDNVEKPEVLNDYLPRAGTGHVLITSCNPSWGDVAEPLRIEKFSRQESIEYLLKRTKQTDKESAAVLSEMLGDLPLALAQAASYIERKKC